jgi:hypothetical protein
MLESVSTTQLFTTVGTGKHLHMLPAKVSLVSVQGQGLLAVTNRLNDVNSAVP